MKKIKLYVFSSFCLVLFVLSTTKSFMEWWSDYRTSSLKIQSARSLYGDLYSVCFLPQFMDTSLLKLKIYDHTSKNIDLYILHDSYLLDRIKKENFKNLNKLTLSDFRGNGIYIQPNKAKRNILIIECSERSVMWRLADTSVVFSKLRIGKPGSSNKNATKAEEMQLAKHFFNPLINQNLEFNLFDYVLFKPIKEFKAILNYNLFNRVVKDIAVSSDKNYLLLNETIDINQVSSSCKYITKEEIDFIANNLNHIKKHYQKRGFNEIYFSIIPNPVSIIDDKRLQYNHKIERIETNYFLRTEYIDVYGIFIQRKNQVFRRDDSHWNNYGLQLWVYEVNSKILQP